MNSIQKTKNTKLQTPKQLNNTQSNLKLKEIRDPCKSLQVSKLPNQLQLTAENMLSQTVPESWNPKVKKRNSKDNSTTDRSRQHRAKKSRFKKSDKGRRTDYIKTQRDPNAKKIHTRKHRKSKKKTLKLKEKTWKQSQEKEPHSEKYQKPKRKTLGRPGKVTKHRLNRKNPNPKRSLSKNKNKFKDSSKKKMMMKIMLMDSRQCATRSEAKFEKHKKNAKRKTNKPRSRKTKKPKVKTTNKARDSGKYKVRKIKIKPNRQIHRKKNDSKSGESKVISNTQTDTDHEHQILINKLLNRDTPKALQNNAKTKIKKRRTKSRSKPKLKRTKTSKAKTREFTFRTEELAATLQSVNLELPIILTPDSKSSINFKNQLNKQTKSKKTRNKNPNQKKSNRRKNKNKNKTSRKQNKVFIESEIVTVSKKSNDTLSESVARKFDELLSKDTHKGRLLNGISYVDSLESSLLRGAHLDIRRSAGPEPIRTSLGEGQALHSEKDHRRAAAGSLGDIRQLKHDSNNHNDTLNNAHDQNTYHEERGDWIEFQNNHIKQKFKDARISRKQSNTQETKLPNANANTKQDQGLTSQQDSMGTADFDTEQVIQDTIKSLMPSPLTPSPKGGLFFESIEEERESHIDREDRPVQETGSTQRLKEDGLHLPDCHSDWKRDHPSDQTQAKVWRFTNFRISGNTAYIQDS